MGYGRDRFHGGGNHDGIAVGHPAFDATRQVSRSRYRAQARVCVSWLVTAVEGVVGFAARQGGLQKSRADFHPFYGLNRDEGGGQTRVQSAVTAHVRA